MPAVKKTRTQKARPRLIPKKTPPIGEDRYRSFFEYVREGFFRGSLDEAGCFTEVNPALVHILGYSSAKDVLSLTLLHDVYTDPKELDHLRKRFETSEKIVGIEVLWKKKNGEHFPVSLYVRAVKNARGNISEYEGVVIDLTVQKRAEGNWQKGDPQFQAFMESTHVATFVYKGTQLLNVSPGAAAITGYSRDELKEMRFWDLMHPDFRQLVRERGLAHLRGEQVPSHYEVKIVTKEGEERWLDYSTGAIELEGKPAIVGTAFDITARKKAEVELEQNRELFQRFMDNSPAWVFMKDEAGKYLYVNKTVEHHIPTVLGKTDAELFSSATAKELRDHDVAAMAAGSVMKFEEATESAEGTRYFTSFKFPVVSLSGKKLLAGLCLDVTKQRKLEDQLRESEERYRTISEITSDYAYAFRVESNSKLVLEWITAAFSRISGLTPEEVLERGGWIDLPHPDDVEMVKRYHEALLSGQEQTCEFRIISKSGEIRWLRNAMRPVWDREQGRVVRIYGAGQDITERKRLEEQLRERVILPKDLGANLRRFRQQLGLTQSVFGQSFGGYSQRQITSYETGEIEIPMGLLLSIRNKGYPLEVVLGESQTDALDKIVGYLSTSWRIHETAKRLTESVLRLLDRESSTVKSIMNRLGVSLEEDAAREHYTLRDMLRRAGIEPSSALLAEEEHSA